MFSHIPNTRFERKGLVSVEVKNKKGKVRFDTCHLNFIMMKRHFFYMKEVFNFILVELWPTQLIGTNALFGLI